MTEDVGNITYLCMCVRACACACVCRSVVGVKPTTPHIRTFAAAFTTFLACKATQIYLHGAMELVHRNGAGALIGFNLLGVVWGA